MKTSAMQLPNSKTEIQQRLNSGRITWTWPLVLVFARLIFAVLAQALVAGIFAMQRHPTPWQAAAPWWTVYGTLIDIGCLALLVWLARREGIRFIDLVGIERHKLWRDLLVGLGFIILATVLGITGGVLSTLLIYGSAQAPPVMGGVPLWATMYSLLVWPIIWGIAEEITYQGYALPRLEVLTGQAWLAVLIVGFGWALQHIALPLMLDWRFMLWRFASSLGISIVLPIIYLRTRRLLPFIVAHWASNFLSVLTLVILPLIGN